MKYKDFQTKGELVCKKMLNHEPLTPEDLEVIQIVMLDPLQEFVRREAPFRLVNMFDLGDEEVNEDLLEEAEKTIRDVIDENEGLYKDIDEKIEEALEEEN